MLSLLVRSLGAVATSLFALILWIVSPQKLNPSPYLLLIAAVAVSAYFGGFIPAMIASLLTALLALLFYLHFPAHAGSIDLAVWLQFSLFLAVSLLVGALTARLRRTQELVEEQLELTGTIASNLAEGVCRIDNEGGLTFVNPAVATIFGRSIADLVGTNVHEAFQPVNADGSRVSRDDSPFLRAVRTGRREQVIDAQFMRRDGTVFPAEYSVSPIRNHERSSGAVIALRDVTDRKRVEIALRESEDRYRTLVETSPDCIWLTDPYGYIIVANRRAAELFAYDRPEEMHDIKALELVAPEDRARSISDRNRVADEGHIRDLEYTCQRADGTTFPAEVSVSVIMDEDGKLQALVNVARDISDRKRAEADLRASEARLAMQYAATKALAQYGTVDKAVPKLMQTMCTGGGWDVGAFWEVDRDSKAVRCRYVWSIPEIHVDGVEGLAVDTTFARGVGLPGLVWDTVEPMWVEDVLSEASLHQGYTKAAEKLHTAAAVPVLVGSRPRCILQFFSQEVLSLNEQSLQAITAIAAQVGQLIERQEAQQQLEHQTMHDAITGLLNRGPFQERLDAAVRSARRSAASVGLLVAGVEGIEEVNEAFGKDHGDMVLQQVASRMVKTLRNMDVVGRTAGDEFAALLPATDRMGSLAAAGKLARALREPFQVSGQRIDVAATVGIAVQPDHGDDALTILRRAEYAMHVAKRTDREYAEFSVDQDEGAANRLLLVRELRQAVEQNQLGLHYVPIVAIATGKIEGVEAIVRWQHPERGLLVADQVTSLAENTGLTQLLGRQILEMVLQQWKAWHDAGLDLRVTVNLPPRQLLDTQFLPVFEALLANWEAGPSALEFEVNESAIRSDSEILSEVLTRLRGMGVSICLSGFGKGHFSLAEVQRTHLDKLKIDRSFVTDVDQNEESLLIARAIVEVGHTLRMQVAAEGVDTGAVWRVLEGMGCDLAQGEYLSDPLPPLELLRRYGQSSAKKEKVSRVRA